jgi:SAM-dependent methyltransferase
VTAFFELFRRRGRPRSAFATYELSWLRGQRPQSKTACPVCGSRRSKTTILRARRRGLLHWLRSPRKLALAACPDCDSLFYEHVTAPAYERPAKHAWATEFYVEQGAAIDALIEPIARLAGRPIGRLLELGCGYGFSLDAGRRLFGWQVLGIDPSPLAAAGSRDLRVPIVAAYAGSDENPDSSFDLVYASEVIEHVGQPREFLQICKARLAGDGVLILTTPDADCIRPETPAATLLPALSLGHHLTLFSRRGLAQALTEAGFSAVAIHADGPRLVAYAANQPFDFDPLRRLDRRLYREYLNAVLQRDDLSVSLLIGLSSRLLKDLTHAGDYSAAKGLFDSLAQLIERERGISIAAPAVDALTEKLEQVGLSGRSGAPWCLPGIFYCRGMIELNHAADHANAAIWFDASARIAAACRAAYAAAGIDDGETAVLQHQAEENAILALSFADPAAAIERLRDRAPRGEFAAKMWQALVIRLIDRGELEFATAAAAASSEPHLVMLAAGFMALHRHADAAAARRDFAALRSADGALAELAATGQLLAATELDPEAVADAAERGGLSGWLVEALFNRLADLGHVAQALRLEKMLVQPQTWQIQSRLGLLKLLASAPAGAIENLTQAFALARLPGSGASDAECCQLKIREALARLMVQDAEGAARAAAELLDPQTTWAVPQARTEMRALLADHPAVRTVIERLVSASVGLNGHTG